MKSCKIISILMFLLLCSNGFSFTSEESVEETVLSDFSNAELEEGTNFSFDSNLSDSPLREKCRYDNYSSVDFRFFSFHCEKLAVEYLSTSQFIDPGLTKVGIIFPFHCFL